MIFACGVRFIRLRSSWVSGCASLSARAAASMASGVMGLSVFLEVVVLLILCCPSGGNNADALLAFGIGYKQQEVFLGHADNDKTLFAVVRTIIVTLDGKRVLKHRLRQIEAHAMYAQVSFGLGVVPFKFQFHNTTGNQ